MKKFLIPALCLLSLNATAQGILDRFTDPAKGRTVFVEKGHYAVGITGGYRSFAALGEDGAGGYSILSFLNIGDGFFSIYNVSPRFSYFVADDLSLGVRLDYDGYMLDSDLRANLGELFNFSSAIESITSQDDDSGMSPDELYDILNVRLSGRHMVSNSWGGSFSVRKYLSFFGSKTFAVFGEARLYGSYGRVNSCPINRDHEYVETRMRTSDVYSAGLKLGGGLCVKLRDNSAFTIGIPLVGATYSYTKQHKETKSGPTNAHMARFNISRDLDYFAIQIGYTHFIKSKKR